MNPAVCLGVGNDVSDPVQVNPPEVSSAEDAVRGVVATAEFWNARHQELGYLRSGGDAGRDEASNEILYAVRLGRLIDIVGDQCAPAAPLRILDAGCGKGWFTRRVASFGHRVDGIDVSEHAISLCRQQAVGQERYAVSRLDQWRPPCLYDVVYCIDVLFHVMNDQVWEASLRNIASLVRWGGTLTVTEHEADVTRTWADYQCTRALSRYRKILESQGFVERGFIPYGFRSGPVGFLVMARSG